MKNDEREKEESCRKRAKMLWDEDDEFHNLEKPQKRRGPDGASWSSFEQKASDSREAKNTAKRQSKKSGAKEKKEQAPATRKGERGRTPYDMDHHLDDSVTISNSWRPYDYSLSSALSQNGNTTASQSEPDISTQRDPPLSQLFMDNNAASAPTADAEDTHQPKPWARLISKCSDLPSYDLVAGEAPDEHGRHNLYVLGRGSTCNPRLETSPRISNRHCLIYCKPNMADRNNVYLEAWIEDISANGTYLNKDITLKKNVPRLLRTGDEIHFINPALVNAPKYPVTADELLRNTFLVVIHLPTPILTTRTLRSQTLSRELQNAIGRSNTVITLLKQDRRIDDHYVVKERIGEGACGTVHLGIDKATGREWAIKIIDTRKLAFSADATAESVTKEAQMLRSLRHPNIVHLEDIFAENGDLFLVMELSRGGDLFDRISTKRRYPEEEAKQVMLQILEAIAYLHDRNVAHRDLKPENILLVHRHDDIQLKLTDFGLAKVADDKQGFKSFCGTPQYFAPEVLERRSTILGQGRYTLAADMWSAGVIMYVLLAGQYPFQEQTLEQQIATGTYTLSGPFWSTISEEAKECIRHLLVVDPNKRWTARQALQCAWLKSVMATGREKQPAGAAGGNGEVLPMLPPAGPKALEGKEGEGEGEEEGVTTSEASSTPASAKNQPSPGAAARKKKGTKRARSEN